MRDWHVVGLAAAVVVGVWAGAAAAGCVLGLLWLGRAPALLLIAGVLLAPVAAWRGAAAWEAAVPRQAGPFHGWAQVAADPVPFGRGLRVTFEVEGERFDAWCYGPLRRSLQERQQGEWVLLAGERRAFGGTAARRAAVRHVVGELVLDFAADVHPGTPLARAGNRVRAVLRSVAEDVMAAEAAALYTGLVIGDDRRQPEQMVEAFRAAGMSHLTAVSGQNVAFLLAAFAPLLRRLRPKPRWAATLALVGWFMSVTRFEPSVLRAGVMAMLAATAYASGRQAGPVRLLGLAVVALVLLDPLLVWSVGFWLSVGATLGVGGAGPWLAVRLRGPMWLRTPVAVTLGAQAGVALPALLVFGRLPLVSLPANLVAVPVAGFVMLYGIPAGLVAGLLPQPLDALLLWPAEVGTLWVAQVAAVAAALEPPPAWAGAGWVVLLLAVAVTVTRHPPGPPPAVPS